MSFGDRHGRELWKRDKRMKKIKVLITGGTGYIGQYLVQLLQSQEYEVCITSRKPHDYINGVLNRQMELMDESTIEGICKEIDIVVHLANIDERLIKNDSRSALLMNSYATRKLYEDAQKNNVKKFIYLSTFHIYGRNTGEIDENTLPSPKTDYGLTHLFAEQYLYSMVNDACKVDVIRLTNGIGLPLNGADKWYLVLNDFCKMVYINQKIEMKSNGLPLRDFVVIKDVVKAIKILIDQETIQESFNIYNISAEKTYSIREIAFKVKEIYEQRFNKFVKLFIPNVTNAELNKVDKLIISSQKIRNLGWKDALTIDDVINDIFNYYEEKKAL